ncbi:MAG: hypothetical protein KAG10_09525 [Methylococcales bacterium]|nr:hypothetical protein [Methylococcales bacterium]MCK5926120.1 hypothetical protein [Methylococcales bacterium]
MRTRNLLLLLLGSYTLSACTVMSYQSRVDYGTSVFKRQNALSTEIMMIDDEMLLSKEDMDELLEVEMEMQQACRLLNEYALKEMDHEPISLLFKKQANDSVDDCAESISDVESLLEDVEIDDAR